MKQISVHQSNPDCVEVYDPNKTAWFQGQLYIGTTRNAVTAATREHERNWAEYYGGTRNVKRSYRKLVLKRMRNKAFRLGFDHPQAVY